MHAFDKQRNRLRDGRTEFIANNHKRVTLNCKLCVVFLLKLAKQSYFDLLSLTFRDNPVILQFTEEIVIGVQLVLQVEMFALKQTLERLGRHNLIKNQAQYVVSVLVIYTCFAFYCISVVQLDSLLVLYL